MQTERRHLLATLLGVLCLVPITAQASDLTALLQRTADDMLTQQNLPGVSIALREPDGRIHTAAAGFADVEAATPMTASTRMPGGSTGKSYVSTLTMLLVEQGVLDLDTPISHWLGEEPWFTDLSDGKQITLSMLLSHTSGLRDHVYEIDFALNAAWQRLWSDADEFFEPEELVAFVTDEDLLFAPGEDYSYTDTGYLLIGLIIEKATGERYYDLLQDRILTPLNLLDTQPATARTAPRLAAGYVSPVFLTVVTGLAGKTMNDQGELYMHPGTEWTGGGLFNTPSMLVRFYAALAEGQIVTPASYTPMVDAGHRTPGTEDHYGFGLYVRGNPDVGMSIGHGGWFPGYSTAAAYFPESGIAICIQTNTDGDAVNLQGPLVALTQQVLSVSEP